MRKAVARKKVCPQHFPRTNMLMQFHTCVCQGRKVGSSCGIFQKSHQPHKPKGKPLSLYYSSSAPIFMHTSNICVSQAHRGYSKNQKEVEKATGFHTCFKNPPDIMVTLYQQNQTGTDAGCQETRLFFSNNPFRASNNLGLSLSDPPLCSQLVL